MSFTSENFPAQLIPAAPAGAEYGPRAADFTPLESFGPVPDGWIWGTATAAHQIEGGNVNNDWWKFEHTPGSGTAESSGDATDSFHRWREDLELVQQMGLDSYRFSLEWSRIEPAEGEFSVAALEHYRQILAAAREMGLKTTLTFHHFTTPLWASEQGGWANPKIVDWFARYVREASEYFGDLIDVACTINEPNMVALLGHYVGKFAPGRTEPGEWEIVTKHMCEAHIAARDVLKAGPGDFPVGITVAVLDIVLHEDDDAGGAGYRMASLPGPESGLPWLMMGAYFEAARGDDFFGVQTYNTVHHRFDGQGLPNLEHWRTTQMTWTFTPEALGHTVRLAAAATGCPIIVTENGIATTDDAERVEYYSRSLRALREAMDDGVDVRGFFAWSLLDNFEWAEGYEPKFGFVEVDRKTFERTPKPSSQWYARLVANTRASAG